MLDIMYEVPSRGAPISEVVINEETIQKGEQPILMYQKGAAAAGDGRRPELPSTEDRHARLEVHARVARRSVRSRGDWVAWMPLLFMVRRCLLDASRWAWAACR